MYCTSSDRMRVLGSTAGVNTGLERRSLAETERIKNALFGLVNLYVVIGSKDVNHNCKIFCLYIFIYTARFYIYKCL